jgi:dihydrolipoamide dehydrogenase
MELSEYDLLVVGGGPGGYTAAIRGAQNGLRTVLVEKELLGGTCLNRGCVPTKSLIEDTRMIPAVRTCHFLKGDMKISVKRIAERRNSVVEGSRQWVRNLLKGNGVTFLSGHASFKDPKCLKVQTEEGEIREFRAKSVFLSTGAVEEYSSGLQADGKGIWCTDDALSLNPVPRRLAVVGAGNRGVEFASIYRNLGVGVVLLEREKRILPHLDPEISERYKKSLADRGIRVFTKTTVTAVHSGANGGVKVILEGQTGQQEFQVDKVLLTGRRRPRYEDLNLAAAGLSPKGEVLGHGAGFQTEVSGIYVIGDAAGPPYYAHKAISQALVAVDHLMGRTPIKASPFIPHCVWGDPEVAAVGLTEGEAIASGRNVRVGEFHFKGNGRAGTMGVDQGLILIVSDAKSREVLGVHMIGPQVTELISLATLAMENGIDVDGIKKAVFAHPSLSETFFEAALATDGQAIHLLMDTEEHEPER